MRCVMYDVEEYAGRRVKLRWRCAHNRWCYLIDEVLHDAVRSHNIWRTDTTTWLNMRQRAMTSCRHCMHLHMRLRGTSRAVGSVPSYTRSPFEDSRLFGPSPWKILATTNEKDISEQTSPWRKSSKRKSCYGDRVYVCHGGGQFQHAWLGVIRLSKTCL